ncbi:sterol desaturase family protein [Altericroceibacterium endophyticum]|uniref:Fatty acid hydroxylase family protein n=1 Tax=Altericroceibacterium endophyticum TaxID=1808508 RepID=A0A6I4T5Q9_9SPHN|nr:sterol desaturase family protein [Altericroceibacterium endophyticum]MXO65552.1 fatty acid hydroxylase family protein [Altericroceibacterium endophyticum]
MDQPQSETGTSPVQGNVLANPAGAARQDEAPSFFAKIADYLPLATVVAICLFWGFAPDDVTTSPVSLLAAAIVVMAWTQGLELVFERHESWRINRRELATDIFYVVLTYTVIGWATVTFAEAPLLSLKQALGIATPGLMELPFIVQAAMVLFLIEFGQYWMHRLMHNFYPLWLTHAPHHHLTQLNALKGAVGNPIELFLISLSVVALFDFSPAAVFCAINVLGVISGFAHANVRADPPALYGFFFTTIRHHSLHHTALSYEDTRCNYANSLIVLDRIFGTYREGESAIVGQDERRRLSIYEQFMFPFQPVIDAIGTRRSNAHSRGRLQSGEMQE